MRFVYNLLLLIFLPFIFVRLFLRSLKQPAYRQRIKERFGSYPFRLEKCLWVHAVSVGEVIAAVPLIKALKLEHPDLPLLVTTMTPTGSERVKASLGDQVQHVYLPYDYPFAVKRFFKTMQPVAGIIIETELWPNLLSQAQKCYTPIVLLNARLSEKSAKGYALVGSLTREMLQSLKMIGASGEKDRERFVELGALPEKVVVTGNIKFDLDVPIDLDEKTKNLKAQFGNRFVWIAASTHEGEDEKVLIAHQQLLKKLPNALLVLVPRHPQRFDAVAALCDKSFKTARRSLNQTDGQVYLADTMGELMLMYSIADVAFVGGSLVENGGHNMLEPAALGKAILTGPSLFNFSDISKKLFDDNAMIKIENEDELAETVIRLASDVAEREALGLRAKSVVDANKGALAHQLELINNLSGNS